MNNSKAHHAPLHPKDTPTETFGCRHSNPDNCSKAEMVDICAFVREDGMCLSPPKSWQKQFQRLQEKETGKNKEQEKDTKKSKKKPETAKKSKSTGRDKTRKPSKTKAGSRKKSRARSSKKK